ncbi:MATE family efflux transporter [Cellulosilyticum ruminicola]|uniref:MATE family efflux transporter n=1 Tax=Cellulosilyticum ruminicola TaxID=425254 RepID=UPI0006D24854
MTVAVIMGIVLMIFGMLFAGNLLGAFGGNEEPIPYGQKYINIFLLGTIFNVSSFVFTSVMGPGGSHKMSVICMIIGCIIM